MNGTLTREARRATYNFERLGHRAPAQPEYQTDLDVARVRANNPEWFARMGEAHIRQLIESGTCQVTATGGLCYWGN